MLSDPDLAFPYLLLLVSGGHCQLLFVAGRRPLPPPRHHDRRRRRRGVRQERETARPRLSRRPGGRAGGGRGRCRRRCRCRARWSARDEPHFSFAGLKSAVLRAQGERALCRCRHRRLVPAGGGRLPRRPHRGARIEAADGATALVVAGGVAANQAIRDGARPGSPPPAACPSSRRPCGCAPTMRR